METMTIPTTPWASLPSYAPAFAGPVDTSLDVRGGAFCVLGKDVDALTSHVGAGVVRFADVAPRIKDIRPGSRAWSPPV